MKVASRLVCLVVVAAAAASPAQAREHRAGASLLVRFAEGIDARQRAAVHAAAGGRVTARIGPLATDVVEVADERAGIRGYRRGAGVLGVEPDGVARALGDGCSTSTSCVVPNDPYFARQWGHQSDSSTIPPTGVTLKHDADVDLPFAWARSDGLGAQIAILDSGIDLDHEDLAAKVVASRNFTRSRTLDDKYGHGTAVAGVAAAIPDNGRGIAGVGADASLINVKVLDDRGIGGCSTVAKGITWAADNGADVINMSLGFSDCTTGRDAVAYAWSKGVLLTAAAGNDGDSSPTYPAYYPQVMAVAATDGADAKTSFSQHGTWVDIAAPGINVFTTFPNHSNQLGKTHYDYGRGTSMSAPYVAGTAGLIWALVADADGDQQVNDDVRARLEQFADRIEGTGTLWAAGRLNACNAAAASPDECPLH